MWKKGNFDALLVGLQMGAATMENNMQVPQKPKIELLYNLGILLLGIYLKETKTLTQKDKGTSMFIAALFTITKTWKQLWCPSMDEWIKKM